MSARHADTQMFLMRYPRNNWVFAKRKPLLDGSVTYLGLYGKLDKSLNRLSGVLTKDDIIIQIYVYFFVFFFFF